MFKTWREQYQANQELKREIERERWEQEKKWREEDRAAKRKALQANAVDLDEHNTNMKVAAGVSYLTLVCHEDTWTFVATLAFGIWKPHWTKSFYHSLSSTCPTPSEQKLFTVQPNLTEGRIEKMRNGIRTEGRQSVLLSGHNLVRILDALREGTAADDVAYSARCVRLYEKFAEFVSLVDPDAQAAQTTGVTFHIDDSLDAAHVTKS